MEAHQQVAAGGDQGPEPRLTLGQFLRRAGGEEFARDEGGKFQFDDAIDGEISEAGEGHAQWFLRFEFFGSSHTDGAAARRKRARRS